MSFATIFHVEIAELDAATWYVDFSAIEYVATLALGSRPRQGLARLPAKRKPRSEIKCEGMNPHTPKGASTLGVWSFGGLPNLHRAIIGGQNPMD
jgi:hypothetical protein